MQDQLSIHKLYSRLTSVFTDVVSLQELRKAIQYALAFWQADPTFQLFLLQEGKIFLAGTDGLEEKKKEDISLNPVFWKDLTEKQRVIKKGQISFAPIVFNKTTTGFLSVGHAGLAEEDDFLITVANLAGLSLNNIPINNTASQADTELFQVLNLFPIVITLKDRQGRFIFANDYARKTLNYCKSIEGKTYADFFPQNSAAELRIQDEKVWKEGKMKIGKYTIDQDKKLLHFLTGKARMQLSGKSFLATYSIDITNEVDAIDSLAISELKYKQFVDTASDIIYRCDSSGKFQFVNQVGLNMLGKTLQEIQKIHYLDLVHPDHRERVRQIASEQFTSRTGAMYYEAPLLTPKGEVWVGANVSMEVHKDWVIGYNGLARNITERKKVENELIKAKQEAEKSTKTKEQFISVMSHEIRTPMNAVVGMANLLKESDFLPHQEQYLDVLKISADNLLNILNNVLDLSKIEAGKLRKEQFRFSLRETIYKIRQTFRHKAEEKGISYKTEIAENVPDIVWGDQIKLNQILLNLVSNAIKFTDSGSVTLTVKLQKKYLSEVVLSFTIEDTGIGIKPDEIPAIFESFTQASSEISSRYGGTGLGLTITKKIVEFLDGEIRASSTPGSGSAFSFTLPFQFRSFEQILDIGIDEHAEKDDLSGLKVLVAEDNEMNQLLINEFLSGKGIMVDLVENGQMALDRLEKRNYNLILMDIQMPVMDGYEAAKKIKSTYTVPIIALTASTSLSEENDQYFDALVIKPFDPKMLFSKIATVTGREFLIKDKKPERRMTSNAVTNLNYLKEASAGNQAFIREMINIFLRQTPGYLSTLRDLGKKQDWLEFRKIMHKIKPTITMMGIYSLEPVVKQIEICSKENRNIEQLPVLLDELEVTCKAAFEELKRELE